MKHVLPSILLMPVLVLTVLSCTRKPADMGLNADTIRSRVLASASSPVIPDWVLPGEPLEIRSNRAAARVYIGDEPAYAQALKKARAERDTQFCRAVRLHNEKRPGRGGIELPLTWCASNLREDAVYWEAWRPEGSYQRRYTVYLSVSAPFDRLESFFSNRIRLMQATNTNQK